MVAFAVKDLDLHHVPGHYSGRSSPSLWCNRGVTLAPDRQLAMSSGITSSVATASIAAMVSGRK